MVFGAGRPRNLVFPINFAGRPYNTLTLPCDRVMGTGIRKSKEIYINLENDREHLHKPYIARIYRVIGLYIFVADSMGLSSFKFSWWAPKDARVLKQSA